MNKINTISQFNLVNLLILLPLSALCHTHVHMDVTTTLSNFSKLEKSHCACDVRLKGCYSKK